MIHATDIRIELCKNASQELVEALELIEQRTMKNPWSAQSLKECFEDAYKLLAIYKKGVVAGFSVIYNTRITTDLLTIAIDPQYQGLGLGRLLLKETLREAIKGGADECFLEVRRSNIRAQSLYKSAGFEVVGVRKNYYGATLGSEAEDAFTMSVSSLSALEFLKI